MAKNPKITVELDEEDRLRIDDLVRLLQEGRVPPRSLQGLSPQAIETINQLTATHGTVKEETPTTQQEIDITRLFNELADLETRYNKLDGRFDHIEDKRLGATVTNETVEERLSKLSKSCERLELIDERLAGLADSIPFKFSEIDEKIEALDRDLKDPQPWANMDERIGTVRQQISSLEERLNNLEEFEKRVEKLERDLEAAVESTSEVARDISRVWNTIDSSPEQPTG